MDDSTKEAILSLVKIGLTSIGTYATTVLKLNDQTTSATIALALTLLTVGWSIWDRLKKGKAQAANLATAMNVGINMPTNALPVTPAEAKAIVASTNTNEGNPQ